ncbi:type 1 fimbrial protein [Salmonella enterica]|nr:type 1 fimbrial protein [Salmonella enterica]
MKNTKRLFLLGAVMAVMSSSAFADTTGTQTFTANIVANTCTVDNLNKAVDLGDLLNTDFANSTFGGKVSNKFIDTGFSITGCPTTVAKVKVTPTFKTDGTNPRFVVNAGTFAAFFATNIDSANAISSAQAWDNGTEKDFTVTNGNASIPVRGRLFTGAKPAGNTSAGTLNYTMSFTFDFA